MLGDSSDSASASPTGPEPDPRSDPGPTSDGSPGGGAAARDLRSRSGILGVSARHGRRDFEVAASHGVTLVDGDGVDHLDADTVTQVVGHAHPAVSAAIAAQAQEGLAVHAAGEYLQTGTLDFAEQLLATFPVGLDTVLFTSTGSEANDLALRVIRAKTNAKGVIVTRHAFHGVTAETAAMSPASSGPSTIGGWVRLVDAPVGDGSAFVDDVSSAAAELAESEYGLAGFVVDPAFTTEGVVSSSLIGSDILQRAAAAVRAAGGLIVADEMHAGLGRLGTSLWSFEGFSGEGGAVFAPDIVTLGQSLGNGMPIGAVVLGRALSESFHARSGVDPVSPFARAVDAVAGDSVSLAAARAVLDLVVGGGMLHHARAIGDYLSLGLSLLASAIESLGAVRGRGLYYAIDVVDQTGSPDGARAAAIVSELQRRGVLIGNAGAAASVMMIRPPLAFSIVDADRLLEQLYGALIATDRREPVGVAAVTGLAAAAEPDPTGPTAEAEPEEVLPAEPSEDFEQVSGAEPETDAEVTSEADVDAEAEPEAASGVEIVDESELAPESTPESTDGEAGDDRVVDERADDQVVDENADDGRAVDEVTVDEMPGDEVMGDEVTGDDDTETG
ncbi:MAG: hypothetical protein RI885_942, partial [Actinomycetota bacterium]